VRRSSRRRRRRRRRRKRRGGCGRYWLETENVNMSTLKCVRPPPQALVELLQDVSTRMLVFKHP